MITIVAIFGILTLLTLVGGVLAFAVGSKGSDGKMSNKLMTARVVFQALTLLALAIVVFLN